MEFKTEIANFLYNDLPNQSGLYHQDIISASDAWLEDDHLYIQWLFPNREPSFINPNAPLLTDEAIVEVLSSAYLKGSIKDAFWRMFTFYQFESQFDPENPDYWWVTPGNHNFLRLTRILHTLKAFSFTYELNRLFNQLEKVYALHEDIIGERTFAFWKDAYEH